MGVEGGVVRVVMRGEGGVVRVVMEWRGGILRRGKGVGHAI